MELSTAVAILENSWRSHLLVASRGHYASAEVLAISLLAIIAPLLVLAPVMRRRPFDLFHPLCAIALTIFWGTTIRGIYILYFGYSDAVNWTFLKLAPSIDPIGILMPGSAVIAGGALCLVTGFMMTGNSRLPIERFPVFNTSWHLPRIRIIAILALVVATLALADFVNQTGGIQLADLQHITKRTANVDGEYAHTFLGYHHVIAHTLPAIFFFIYLILFIKTPGNKAEILVFLALFGLIAIALPILGSERSAIMYMVFCALVILSLKYRIPFITLAGVGTLLLALIVVMGILRDKQLSWKEYRAAARETLFENFNGVDVVKTGHMYNAVPNDIDYQLGKTMIMCIYAPIPRSLWPSKPQTNLGYVVAQELYAARSTNRGGADPGLMAELILNFGVIGVPFGMFLFGVMLSLFCNTFRPSLHNPPVTLLYVSMLIPLSVTFLQGEATQGIIQLLTSGISTLAIIFMIGSRQRSQL